MKIAIIGAGAAGLAAAHDLVNAGHRVTIFEAAPKVGGLAAGFKAPHWDWTLEKFYHHWFQSDRHILGLIDELGWRADVLFPRPQTVVYHAGDFYPLDSPLAVLRFPGFSLLNRLRFGAVAALLKLLPDGVALEGHTADAWLRRWMGSPVYATMMQPLLVSKFGERYYRDVTMAWMWARVKARTTRLGTFKGGFQTFLEKLANDLERRGVEIKLRTQVDALETGPMKTIVLKTPHGPKSFDHCIATTSPRLLAQLAPQLSGDYREKLLGLKSMGAVVLVLALERRLTNYYWFNLPKEAGFPFLALVEHTNFVPEAHFGGDHIIYCGDYLDSDHEYFTLTEDELLGRFLPALKRFNADFDPSWVKQHWLFRTKYAQPVPFVNHSRDIPDLQTPLYGLWLASMSQVYPWDRGTNFAVELGRRTARRVMAAGAPARA
ncbi:MAG: NAD(P)/FAD-dependent oxidoreductase [Anaerolineales bacterium]